MPRVAYAALISESVEELVAVERDLRGQPTQVRVRMLRYLKEGRITSLRASTELLGYSLAQLYRWWQRYRAEGLAGLLRVAPRPHPQPRLTPAAWAGLEAEMKAGKAATLKDAQRYLADTWQIHYSLNGIWYHLQQRCSRKKTGRRRHAKADAKAQAAYKRDLRPDARGTPLRRGLGLR